MKSLETNIKKQGKKIQLELDEDQFERLAGLFGFFNDDFLKSIDRAEEDYKEGKVKKIDSLADIA